jgi:chaperonin cofactor prefoldin
MMQIQKNLQRYLRSTNIEIRTQYEKIVFELINIILDINKLKDAKDENERLDAYANIEKNIEKNDLISN